MAKVVLLLGSRSSNVQRSTALVLGNIAQDDFNRERLGTAGAVEALFLAISNADDYQVRVPGLRAARGVGYPPSCLSFA